LYQRAEVAGFGDRRQTFDDYLPTVAEIVARLFLPAVVAA
jgi:hypothetical protein